MKKLYIDNIFNTCTEVHKSMEEAVNRALEEKSDGDYIYLNHYVDKDNGLDGWRAYLAEDGDMNGTRYISIEDYKKEGISGYWEEAWDEEEEIHW